MSEVVRDLVHGAPFVEEERRAGVAEVVGAEVGEPSPPERGNPAAAAPVLPTEVAALAVAEDERKRLGLAGGEVELGELLGDRREELGLTGALRLRRRELLARDGTLDEQARSRVSAVVDDVAPLKRERLARSEALVGEHAHERGVRRAELRTDRLDRLGGARVDRLVANVGQPPDAEHGIPLEATPLDRAVEDALQDAERPVDCGRAGTVGAERGGVGVDRLAVDVAQALPAEVRNDPLVQEVGVGRERAGP